MNNYRNILSGAREEPHSSEFAPTSLLSLLSATSVCPSWSPHWRTVQKYLLDDARRWAEIQHILYPACCKLLLHMYSKLMLATAPKHHITFRLMRHNISEKHLLNSDFMDHPLYAAQCLLSNAQYLSLDVFICLELAILALRRCAPLTSALRVRLIVCILIAACSHRVRWLPSCRRCREPARRTKLGPLQIPG